MPNVKSRSAISGDIHSIQSVILRLFASVISVEKKKRKLTKTSEDLMDETKLSLKECVIEIDRQLRSSEITFRGKNTPPNPSVIKTSDLKEPPFVVNGINIFQTCLGVNYITIEQSRAFEDDNYPILITGAVGSGKTLVLLAKTIHLILTKPGNTILLVVCNDFELVSYSEIFQKANFKVFERRESEDKIDENLLAEHDIIISHDDMTPLGAHQLYTDIILNSRISKISTKKKTLFIDDIQALNSPRPPEAVHEGWSCATVDSTQVSASYYIRKIENKFKNSQIHWLGKSYRNTQNINSQLITINLKCKLSKQKLLVESESLQLSHIPEHGHFIHGPQIIVKLYRMPRKKCFFYKLFAKELDQNSDFYQDSRISCAFLMECSMVCRLEQSLTVR